MNDWFFHTFWKVFDTTYPGTIMFYGFIPAILSFLVCYNLSVWARWPFASLMLLTVGSAVKGSAHDFYTFLIGCAVYFFVSVLALYFRARKTKTSFVNQHPWDLIIFLVGTVILTIFYQAPQL